MCHTVLQIRSIARDGGLEHHSNSFRLRLCLRFRFRSACVVLFGHPAVTLEQFGNHLLTLQVSLHAHFLGQCLELFTRQRVQILSSWQCLAIPGPLFLGCWFLARFSLHQFRCTRFACATGVATTITSPLRSCRCSLLPCPPSSTLHLRCSTCQAQVAISPPSAPLPQLLLSRQFC